MPASSALPPSEAVARPEAAAPAFEPQSLTQLLQGARDTTARAAPADTSAIGRFSEDLNEAARLLVTGEWGQLWQNFYTGFLNSVIEAVPAVLRAALIFALLYVAYRMARRLLNHVLTRSRRVDAGLQNLLMRTFSVVVLAFIAIIVLGVLGLNVTALVAGLSIVGIAVGFAARDSLENFIAGITILVDRPFRIGDNIDLDGQFGTIEEITLRSTRLRTLNNQIMVMPNVQMINQKVVNHTMLGIIRIEVHFGIAYKEYPQEARAVVLGLTEGDPRLHPDYPPKVVVTGLNDSSVDLSLRLYLRNPKLEVPVRFEYIEKVREALREADIEIPFPHLQLFIDEAKAFEHSRLMQPPRGNGHDAEAASSEDAEEEEREGEREKG